MGAVRLLSNSPFIPPMRRHGAVPTASIAAAFTALPTAGIPYGRAAPVPHNINGGVGTPLRAGAPSLACTPSSSAAQDERRFGLRQIAAVSAIPYAPASRLDAQPTRPAKACGVGAAVRAMPRSLRPAVPVAARAVVKVGRLPFLLPSERPLVLAIIVTATFGLLFGGFSYQPAAVA